jgi:uncharacterized damage-inducible protein DinB
MKKILQLLEYTFWANDLFVERLKEQQNLSLEIINQMSHIFSAHRTWLERINGRGTLPSLWKTIEQNNWEGINIELYNESCDVVKSTALDHHIRYKNSEGVLFEQPLEDILYHLINHSTHHRAQVAYLMRQHQILPPKSDYIYYLRQL